MSAYCPFCKEEGKETKLRYLGEGIVYCEEHGALDGIEAMGGRYWPAKQKKQLRSKDNNGDS